MSYALFKSVLLRKVVFYTDGSSVIVEKSTNVHIFSDEDMFNDKIEPIIYNGVANMVRKDLILRGLDTVSWYWTDDEEKLHTNKLNNVLYFTYFPV